MRTFQLVKMATHIDAQLASNGLEIRQVGDLSEVGAIARSMGKPGISSEMDPAKNDFTSRNCCWLVLYRSGAPIGMGGMRFDDLGPGDPTDYLMRKFSRHFEGGIESFSKEVIREVRGRTCYIGDLFGRKGQRGSLTALSLAAQACKVHAAIEWDPDIIYTFLMPHHVAAGASELYGFARQQMFSKTFRSPKAPRSNDEFFSRSSRSELNSWVDESLSRLEAKGVIQNLSAV